MIFRLFVFAVVVTAGLIGWRYWHVHTTYEKLEAPVLSTETGPEDAPVTIVEFFDYRCAACRFLHTPLARLAAEREDVRIVFHPLPVFMEPSIREARLALAAAHLGHFDEVHQWLITRGEAPVSDAEIIMQARELGISEEEWRAAMMAQPVQDRLLFTLDAATMFRVAGVPALMINREFYQFAEDNLSAEEMYQNLSDAVDAVLAGDDGGEDASGPDVAPE